MDEIDETMIPNSIKYQQICFAVFVCLFFVNCHQDGHFINAISKSLLFFLKALLWAAIVNMLSVWTIHTSTTLTSIFFCIFCLIFSAGFKSWIFLFKSAFLRYAAVWKNFADRMCSSSVCIFFNIETCHIWDKMNSKGEKKGKASISSWLYTAGMYIPHSQCSFCNCSQSVQSR